MRGNPRNMSMLKPKMSEDHCGVKGNNNKSRRRPATVGSAYPMECDHHSLTWTIGSRAGIPDSQTTFGSDVS